MSEYTIEEMASVCQERDQLRSQLDTLRADWALVESALKHWRVEYVKELDIANKGIKFCEDEKDSHGVNFHQGLRSGLVHCDIILAKLKDALKSHSGSGWLRELLKPTLEALLLGTTEQCHAEYQRLQNWGHMTADMWEEET